MFSIKNLNKSLNKTYEGAVTAALVNDCIILKGEVDTWQQVVAAGKQSAHKGYFVVNEIIAKSEPKPPMRVPTAKTDELNGKAPDVLVIGAGIVGASIARELTKFDISVLIVDKEHDVALHASSRNDGMVHPGIDLKKGQLKQKYNALGNKMYGDICKELDVQFKRTGQFLCFKNKWLAPFIKIAPTYWRKLGVPCRFVDQKQLAMQEPHLSKDVCFALSFPTAGIVCPYGLTIAYAENAMQNGAEISFDTAVLSMEVQNNSIKSVTTNKGVIFPKVVVNAAGVFSDDVAQMANDKFFSIHPRRGTNSIQDKKAADKVCTITSGFGTSSTKTTHTKGGGMVSTVDGNLLIGPDAHETNRREDFATYKDSIDKTFAKQSSTVPSISTRDIITYFTGVRASTYEEDFVVQKGRNTKNIVHAAGIQSPGLTAAPAIAQDIAQMTKQILEQSMQVNLNTNFNPNRKAIKKMTELSDKERDNEIRQNPDYGIIVCRCEEISRGEIIDALNSIIPCDTVDGVKRRIRAGMGRCQGGFCGPQIAQIIAEHNKCNLKDVLKSGEGSNIVYGENKEAAI